MDLIPDLCLIAGIALVLAVVIIHRLVSRYLTRHVNRALGEPRFEQVSHCQVVEQ